MQERGVADAERLDSFGAEFERGVPGNGAVLAPFAGIAGGFDREQAAGYDVRGSGGRGGASGNALEFVVDDPPPDEAAQFVLVGRAGGARRIRLAPVTLRPGRPGSGGLRRLVDHALERGDLAFIMLVVETVISTIAAASETKARGAAVMAPNGYRNIGVSVSRASLSWGTGRALQFPTAPAPLPIFGRCCRNAILRGCKSR